MLGFVAAHWRELAELAVTVWGVVSQMQRRTATKTTRAAVAALAELEPAHPVVVAAAQKTRRRREMTS